MTRAQIETDNMKDVSDGDRQFIARTALMLFIGGLTAPLCISVVAYSEHVRTIAFLLGVMAEMLAVIFGIIGRKHASGKIALFGGAIILAAIIVYMAVALIMRLIGPFS